MTRVPLGVAGSFTPADQSPGSIEGEPDRDFALENLLEPAGGFDRGQLLNDRRLCVRVETFIDLVAAENDVERVDVVIEMALQEADGIVLRNEIIGKGRGKGKGTEVIDIKPAAEAEKFRLAGCFKLNAALLVGTLGPDGWTVRLCIVGFARTECRDPERRKKLTLNELMSLVCRENQRCGRFRAACSN
jgi:hypothetical protein